MYVYVSTENYRLKVVIFIIIYKLLYLCGYCWENRITRFQYKPTKLLKICN